jgi:hypothetical protein
VAASSGVGGPRNKKKCWKTYGRMIVSELTCRSTGPAAFVESRVMMQSG